jgi:hypothetical protein
VDPATSKAFDYISAQGGIPAAIIVGAWLIAKVLVPFLDRVATSWEKFLNGLQIDIKTISGSIETVGSALRENTSHQVTLIQKVAKKSTYRL